MFRSTMRHAHKQLHTLHTSSWRQSYYASRLERAGPPASLVLCSGSSKFKCKGAKLPQFLRHARSHFVLLCIHTACYRPCYSWSQAHTLKFDDIHIMLLTVMPVEQAFARLSGTNLFQHLRLGILDHVPTMLLQCYSCIKER